MPPHSHTVRYNDVDVVVTHGHSHESHPHHPDELAGRAARQFSAERSRSIWLENHRSGTFFRRNIMAARSSLRRAQADLNVTWAGDGDRLLSLSDLNDSALGEYQGFLQEILEYATALNEAVVQTSAPRPL